MRKVSTSDNHSNDPIAVINEHFTAVTAACFVVLADDDFLVTGSLSGDVFVNDLHRCKAVVKMNSVHSNKVIALKSLISHKHLFLSHGRDGVINVFKLKMCHAIDFKLDVSLLIKSSQFTLAPFSVFEFIHSVLIAVVSNKSENSVCVSNVQLESNSVVSDELIEIQKDSKNCVITSLKFSGNSSLTYLFVGNEASLLQCYTIESKHEYKEVKYCLVGSFSNVFGNEPIISIDYDIDRCLGVVGSVTEQIITFKLDSNLRKNSVIKIANPGTSCVILREDYKLCVAGCWDHRIRLFKWPTMNLLKVILFHKDTVECVAFSERNRDEKYLLAACSKDNLVTVWDFYNYKLASN